MGRILISCCLLLFVLGLAERSAAQNPPVPGLSTVPPKVTLTTALLIPGNPVGRFDIHVEGLLGPVAGGMVEVEFSQAAMDLISWCVPGGPPGGGNIFTGVTDSDGDINFTFRGGGCIRAGDPFTPVPWSVEVRCNNVVLADIVEVASPDVVSSASTGPSSETGVKTCGASGVITVGLADAVWHTIPISTYTPEPCSDVAPPFGVVDLNDALGLTPYINVAAGCPCM